MTKEEILQEAKSLHYTDKLAIAQSLIQLSRKELEQLTSQFLPRIDLNKSNCVKIEKSFPADKSSPETQKSALTFEEIVANLRKLKCKKEKTMLNSIAAMHQFRGGISEADAKKIIQKMCSEQIIDCDAKGNIVWKIK